MNHFENATEPGKVTNKRAGSDGKSYFVYLLLCDDGSYYTGYTNNVTSRLERHRKGYGASYTRMRKPKRVVYVEEFKTRVAAIRRERHIKTLTHKEKRQLTLCWSRRRARRPTRK
jgi:putative endonuclease